METRTLDYNPQTKTFDLRRQYESEKNHPHWHPAAIGRKKVKYPRVPKLKSQFWFIETQN